MWHCYVYNVTLIDTKGFYPYEYMNDWEKVNGKLLLEKENFYSHLNRDYITDVGYRHVKRVCKGFTAKKLEEYHDMIKTIHYC